MAADATLSGLDALELAGRRRLPSGRRLWAATWPKLAAVVLVLGIWQAVYWSGWRDPWLLPAPASVGAALWEMGFTSQFWAGIWTTMSRALVGFSAAVLIGGVIGVAVARIKVLRAAIGSTITGLQTMPSIAWFPAAIILFGLDEPAIYFVLILGAAPSIANGVIAGVDFVPPLLIRAGRNIGAKGLNLYTHIIGPASLPSIVAGLKQGWAFAWRSLLAGELLVLIPGTTSLGHQLDTYRQTFENRSVYAIMLTIFGIGVLVDFSFTRAEKFVRHRWGVVDAAAESSS